MSRTGGDNEKAHWRKNVREVDLNPPKDGLFRGHGWSTYCVQVQWMTYPSGGGQPGAPKGWEEAVSSL